jgi:hypothetical protein
MPRLVLASLVLVGLLTCSAYARAEPTVSLGAGGSIQVGGGRLGLTLDGQAAWWLRPTLAIAVRGGLGRMGRFDPIGSSQFDPFAAEVGAGPMYRRCRTYVCGVLSSLLGFHRQRASYVDGLVQDDPWTEQRDSLFGEGRATGQLLLGRSGHVSLDASLGLRFHELVAYDSPLIGDDGADEDRWIGVVTSLGLSGHF